MPRITWIATTAGTLLALALVAARGQEATQPTSAPAGLPVSLAGFTDEGTFFLFVNEERIATLETQ